MWGAEVFHACPSNWATEWEYRPCRYRTCFLVDLAGKGWWKKTRERGQQRWQMMAGTGLGQIYVSWGHPERWHSRGKPLAMALNQVSNFMRKSLRSKMLVPLHHFVSLIISAPDTALICLSLDFYEAGVRLVDSRTPFSAPNKQGMVWICPSTHL